MATTTGSVGTLLRDGMQALLLVTADGFVIDAAVRTPAALDVDTLAAETAGIFRAASLIARDVRARTVKTLTLDLEDDLVVAAVPVAGEAIGILVAQHGPPAPDVRRALEEMQGSLQRILEQYTGKTLVEAMTLPGTFDPKTTERPRPTGRGRIALKDVEVLSHGHVATVRVTLHRDDRETAAKTVGRDLPGQRAILAGEAAIHAMLDLLPAGHAVELTHLQATTQSREALWVLVRFLSPDSEQSLFGIAPVQDGDEPVAAAKAVLNAVNRRIGLLLDAPPP